MLLLVIAALLLLIPGVFRFALRQLIALEGWRHGVEVQIGRVEGSLYEPVVLLRSQWTFHSRAGCLTRFEVTRAEAEFSWQEFRPGHLQRWFRRLSLDGVTGKVQLPPVSPVGSPLRPEDEGKRAWYPAPTRVEAQGVDLLIQSESDFVRVLESRFLISEQQAGFIDIGHLVVQQPILTRTFHNIHGATALQDGRVQIADLQLDPAVQVRSVSADVREIARGRLDLDLQIDAFGGRIHAQAETIPHERGTELEAGGNFNQIAIAPLAGFLGITDAAGGQIKEGNFSFRGSPRDFFGSAVKLRLEAVNFQWESRQWDSLTLGATLLDRRVQIPELELHQGHNELSLSGDVAVPNGRRPWWQSDFNFKIAARIENLTELSALLLPDFRYAAGRMRIDGSGGSKDQQYFGALIVSGSDLTWRSAPIQELRAALRLAGKELQVANLDLLNKDDYLLGQGVINLEDGHLYRGELRASVEDLATYAAILQQPLVPASLAGGASLRWMGEGSAKGQSGRFTARLRHLRPLTPAASRLHPVDAELEGSYAPASLQFSKLNIADESCALTAQADIRARSVNFSSLKLTHGADVWLEGQALLPLDVWDAWPQAKLPKLAEESLAKVHLKAAGLALGTAARLTGWNWPLGGAVDGEIEASGTLGHLQTSGQVALREGRFPIEGDTDYPTLWTGTFALAGQTHQHDRSRPAKRGGALPCAADAGSRRISRSPAPRSPRRRRGRGHPPGLSPCRVARAHARWCHGSGPAEDSSRPHPALFRRPAQLRDSHRFAGDHRVGFRRPAGNLRPVAGGRTAGAAPRARAAAKPCRLEAECRTHRRSPLCRAGLVGNLATPALRHGRGPAPERGGAVWRHLRAGRRSGGHDRGRFYRLSRELPARSYTRPSRHGHD